VCIFHLPFYRLVVFVGLGMQDMRRHLQRHDADVDQIRGLVNGVFDNIERNRLEQTAMV
jgi:hypothetical protein